MGGGRLAYMATATDDQVPNGSYLSAPSSTSKAVSRTEGFAPAKISVEASDEVLGARLWDRSAELVGV